MFTVYVLFSARFDRLYIGCTFDLEQRLISHNELATKGYTVKFRPWRLIYTEVFDSKTEALTREKELKSHQGREFLRTLI